jgi:FixJ family two-component response regulator
MQRVVGIVDDDPAMLSALGGLIEAAGYDTELFSSGEALLEAVATSTAACFVIDIQLGGITGIEVGRQLAARGIGAPIIFVSGGADHLAAAARAEVGGIAFLRKPFAADRLLEAIENAFRPRDRNFLA